jgi:hypothetical protein
VPWDEAFRGVFNAVWGQPDGVRMVSMRGDLVLIGRGRGVEVVVCGGKKMKIGVRWG